MPWDDKETIFKVVVNLEEQYSIWPDYDEIPKGWMELAVTGTKEQCLEYIENVWKDMRPLSLRKQIEEISDNTS